MTIDIFRVAAFSWKKKRAKRKRAHSVLRIFYLMNGTFWGPPPIGGPKTRGYSFLFVAVKRKEPKEKALPTLKHSPGGKATWQLILIFRFMVFVSQYLYRHGSELYLSCSTSMIRSHPIHGCCSTGLFKNLHWYFQHTFSRIFRGAVFMNFFCKKFC